MSSILVRLQGLARKARARIGLGELHRAPAPAPAPVATPEPVASSVVVKEPNWEQRSQAELVDHIVEHFHARLRRDLPLLAGAAHRLEREHAQHPALPKNLAAEIDTLATALEGHMLREENVLFPMLRTAARGGQLDMPIRMMMRDHDDHDETLERIRECTGGLTAPPDASAAWTDLYAGLARLETELGQHIYLENNILFARASGAHDE